MNSTIRRGNKATQKGNSDLRVRYTKAVLSRDVPILIRNIGSNLTETLEKTIASSIEGKCIADGYVKSETTKLVTHSSGSIQGNLVSFQVAFECEVCYPVYGMKVVCVAKNITKAGIRAESSMKPNPLVIFIARDHHNKMPYFSQVKEGDNIEVKIIGQRFELNDKYISIIAELVDPNKKEKKIVIEK